MDGISNLSPEFQTAFQKAVQMERKPLDSLVQKKEVAEAKLGLINDVLTKVDGVKKLLPDLNTPTNFLEVAVNSSNDRSVTGVAEKGKAALGAYNIEVLQLASPASAMSNGFADRNETKIGTGYFSITMADGEEREIFIDNENATLDGVAQAINAARIGMRASVISDKSDPDAPYRLLLASSGTGAESGVEYPDFYFVDGEEDFYIDKERPSVNALIRYEGLEIESPTNELKEIIPGVSVQLRGISDGPVTLNIDQDTPKTSGKIKGLVEGLNGVLSFIQTQNTVNEKSDTRKTLSGDYGIRTAETRLRQALQQNLMGGDERTVRGLADIGIQFNRNGTLNLEETKLASALKNNFDEVADLLAGDGVTSGVITRLASTLNTISGSQAAVLSSQKKNITDKVARIDKDIEAKEKIVEKKTENLKQKLAKAQDAISSIQQQGSQLAAQLGGMAK